MRAISISVRDGRLFLATLGGGLFAAGIIAILLGISGRFLPHDEAFLGMSARDLCALDGCRIVHFMIHDRISFGGVLIALGIVYFWLVAVPLSEGEAWAWWLLLVSGAVGFISFFAYLGFGYFDLWHALGTLSLFPCFVAGLYLSRRLAAGSSLGMLLRPSAEGGVGRWILEWTMLGIFAGGLTILVVGMTCVFVPQDLTFLGLSVEEMKALNPHLVPLIAHDRAGFGGALCSCGIALYFAVRCGKGSRSLWWTVAAAGLAGFGAGIGAHPFAGYVDPVHLAPAVLGAVVYVVGLIASYRWMKLDPHSDGDAEPDERNGGSLALPKLAELGPDLDGISPMRRMASLAAPFCWCAAYFACASAGWWSAAVFALVALSFVTYGSVSHDLVHRSLRLPRFANDVLLCVIELLALRSGHAYQAAHLHHHARYPHEDDIEARAARGTFFGAILEGFAFQPCIWMWALRHAPRNRNWIVGEGVACLILIAAAAAAAIWTPIFLVYALLMIAGSWVIPLVTSYIPHDPTAPNELLQTRVFRGTVASLIAFGHLYHLEHHLYPSVPHQNWPRLARRLDPYFHRAGITPIRFWF